MSRSRGDCRNVVWEIRNQTVKDQRSPWFRPQHSPITVAFVTNDRPGVWARGGRTSGLLPDPMLRDDDNSAVVYPVNEVFADFCKNLSRLAIPSCRAVAVATEAGLPRRSAAKEGSRARENTRLSAVRSGAGRQYGVVEPVVNGRFCAFREIRPRANFVEQLDALQVAARSPDVSAPVATSTSFGATRQAQPLNQLFSFPEMLTR